MNIPLRAASLLALPFIVVLPCAAQSMAGGSMNANRAQFGSSVAISQNDVLVGEPSNTTRTGLVYVYRKTGARWGSAAQLAASDGRPGDGFGAAMATHGNTVLVSGARMNENKGAVYVFDRTGNTYRQSAMLTASDAAAGDAFGTVLAVQNNVAVVSAPMQSQAAGAVYVFRRQGTSWSQVAKLVSSEAAQSNVFGAAVAIDGNDILVGEPGFNNRTGVVRVFSADASGSYKETAKVAVLGLGTTSMFGAPISVQNDMLLIGASAFAVPFSIQTTGGIGYVYEFKKSAPSGEPGPPQTAPTEWREFRRLAPFEASRNDAFGMSIAFDGDQVWIGAPYTLGLRGVVYHYYRTGRDSLWTGVERVTAENVDAQDRFGSAIAARGDLAAIAMGGDDYGLGTVVIMERVTGTWRQTSVLKSPPEGIASIMSKKVECGGNGKAAAFECSDYDLMSFMSIQDLGGPRGVRLSGNWGWTDPETGREYAIVGRMDGTSFVDVTNPEKPVLVGDLPKTPEAQASSWREMKTYKNWALIVSDGSGPHGIQFFDLTRLRNFKGTPLKLTADHIYRDLASIHNIVVNEESGMAAAVGANGGGNTCGGGLHMIDIKDPTKPRFLGCFTDRQTGRGGTGYSHDALCLNYRGPDRDYQGKEICLGSNETMLSIADVSNKSEPKAISRASYPNVGYTHQGWYDEEQRYFYMNDELDETGGKVKATRTIIWDLSDLDDPQVAGEFYGTTQASDHNLYVIGNLMYQSNYNAGLRIIDITDRKNPKEVGYFDTVPYGGNTPGFGGSWNNYPFFKSGNIIVSSGAEGLFVVRKKGPKVVS